MKEWSDFFVAIVSAAAALTGLIFVGVSISLSRILSIPVVVGRASEPLILLITTVIVSLFCLVPGQSSSILGIEILATGIAASIMTLKLDIIMLKKTAKEYRGETIGNLLFTVVTVLPIIICGLFTFLYGFSYIYWLIPAIIFSFIKAVLNAWVILIEIHR